jgi:hypothetical protein
MLSSRGLGALGSLRSVAASRATVAPALGAGMLNLFGGYNVAPTAALRPAAVPEAVVAPVMPPVPQPAPMDHTHGAGGYGTMSGLAGRFAGYIAARVTTSQPIVYRDIDAALGSRAREIAFAGLNGEGSGILAGRD